MLHGESTPPLHRRPAVRAIGLVAVLTADGVAVWALGSPSWVIAAYVAAGLLVAAACVRLGSGPARPPRREQARARPVPRPAPAAASQFPRTAIGYVRGPSGGRAETIAAWCRAHGFVLARVEHDPDAHCARPALGAAVDAIAAGEAYALVAARLADLADGAPALRRLLARLRSVGGALVAIDVGLDMSTDAGRIVAAAVASVSGGGRPGEWPGYKSD